MFFVGTQKVPNMNAKQRIRERTAVQRKLASAGLSQSEVSRRSGLDVNTVSRAVRGDAFSARAQREIAAVVGMHPEDLFGTFTHPRLRRAQASKGAA